MQLLAGFQWTESWEGFQLYIYDNTTQTLTQDKPYMCKITLRHFHATPVAMEEQYYIFWVCICKLSYPACNVHVPHCHLWPVQLYIFFHIISLIAKKKKKNQSHNVCFDFLYKSISNNSHSKKNWARYDQKTYIGVQVKYLLFLSDFIKTWIFLTAYWKIHKHQKSWKSV